MNNHPFSTEDEILNEALRREEEARAFYAELLQHNHVHEVRELLETLKIEEEKHLGLIEKMITQLRLGTTPHVV